MTKQHLVVFFIDYTEDLRGAALLKVIDLTAELVLENFLRDVHAGTHIESPAYLLREAKRIDQYELETFVKPAVLLDLTHKEPGQAIDDEDLEAAEERAGLALREGEIVLLQTNRNTTKDAADSSNHLYLSENGAQFLEFKRPSIVGTDAVSLDPHGSNDLPAHSILMQADILVLESLCNLEKIGQPRFQLVALPLKLSGSASPVRAAAMLEG
jgi:arylformamidase